MLTNAEFNAFCESLPATTHVVQWRGADVWKVGSKVFALGGEQEEGPWFTFKVSKIAYEMLRERPGLRPAPYFATRGMSWIQHYQSPGLSHAEMEEYLRQSHRLVSLGLSRKKRHELGLGELE